jgi:hypothetical protein
MNIEDVTLYFREGGSDKALLTRCPQSRKKSLTLSWVAYPKNTPCGLVGSSDGYPRDPLVRDLHRAPGRRRSNLQWGERESRRDQDKARKYAAARCVVWNDRRRQIGYFADLLAQIGHRFGFRLIVEEGLSHAVLTQTQGCEPVIVNPNGNLIINYLDTCEAPLSPMHLAFSAGLCMLLCGNEGLDGEKQFGTP